MSLLSLSLVVLTTTSAYADDSATNLRQANALEIGFATGLARNAEDVTTPRGAFEHDAMVCIDRVSLDAGMWSSPDPGKTTSHQGLALARLPLGMYVGQDAPMTTSDAQIVDNKISFVGFAARFDLGGKR